MIEAGRADFVTDLVAELPLIVIAELLGVPREDRHRVFDWSNQMVGGEDPEFAAHRRPGHPGRHGAVRLRLGAVRQASGWTRTPTS